MLQLMTMAGMILILSPAKTLNLAKMAALKLPYTEPKCSSKKTKLLVDIMKGRSKSELKSLLGVSDKIADTVLQVRRIRLISMISRRAAN